MEQNRTLQRRQQGDSDAGARGLMNIHEDMKVNFSKYYFDESQWSIGRCLNAMKGHSLWTGNIEAIIVIMCIKAIYK